uniref:Uncharacterized protein n=1 Tax=Cajanus cajan TaxID=3821 RepID=A0A151TRT9_CAJCA|nr:hypothetical protein KK1_008951 [Cajanus cajan]
MGLQYKKIHACPNDYILYRKEFEALHKCPRCGLSRYKVKDGGCSSDEDVDMDNINFDGMLCHPVDSLQWKKIDSLFPNFGSEARNLRLKLALDGMNPFGNLSTNHNSWSVLLSIYNLPPWLCMKRKYVILCMMIAGKGHHACSISEQQTSYLQLKHGKKIVYTRHQKFLRPNHPYRRLKKVFNGCQEHEFAPTLLTSEKVNDQVKDINIIFGKIQKKSTEKKLWKKRSIFFDLPYWCHLDVRHYTNVMHVEKNVCDSVIGILLNIN